MTVVSGDDEATWTADRRAFVADSRDGAADDREVVADARELVADTREDQLDAWERRLEARAAELGLPSLRNAQRTDGVARTLAAEGRIHDAEDRDLVTSERNEETKRRLAESPPTLLALAFAEIAEQLYDAPTFDEVLQRIAEAAVATVAGCSVASVTVRVKDGYRTAAATHPTASAVDEAQYLAAEGPSLDAFSAALVSAPSFPDSRWPLLAAHPSEAGVESAVSYRLLPSRLEGGGDPGGSLNTYGSLPESFDEAAKEIGFILAAHASLAARAVGERSTLEGLGEDLQTALFSRDVIGQAKGILMERLRITPDDAFDVLRRSSQRLNVRLREVARSLTETGEVPSRDLQLPGSG